MKIIRGFFTLLLICILLTPTPASAFFQKKDYKQHFLQDALNSEKRKNLKAAFHSYEKAMYYYKKDTKVIESYAQFCERQKFFDKAQELYEKLYVLTKDKKYLFKGNFCAIKNGKISNKELEKTVNEKYFSQAQKNELNIALIYHFAYKEDWVRVNKTCAKIPKKYIGIESITTCILASEKVKDKKGALGYYLRYSELFPKDSGIINKIITLTGNSDNYALSEQYIKKLIALNPKDNGIKYSLAGLYEKHKQWKKAAEVYKALIASGDTSEHVKNSNKYVLSELNPKPVRKIEKYIPKPLSGYKLQEKLFYENLDAKNYSKALVYLNKMLKEEPKNTKLLRHKVDITFAQENYEEAIIYLEKIQKLKPLSVKDTEFLAFLYSKMENSAKSLDIIENLIQTNPNDEELLNLALEYSMAQKNWDKALVYTDKLLELDPTSEKLLKSRGDMYSAKKDFPNAAIAYEKLVEIYPSPEYQFELSNLYMANQDFANAQRVLEPIYQANLDNEKVVYAYLNVLLAQQKTASAYWLIKNHHLEKTKEGYMVFGDMNMLDKCYKCAIGNYAAALRFEPESEILQNKLAQAYRQEGCIAQASKLYKNVLCKNSENIDAQLGMGSLEIDKKNYAKARQIFNYILQDNPDYKPAKIATAHSYLANDDKMNAIKTLNQMPQDDEAKFLKAQAYYDMNMWSDSKRVLKGVATKDAEALKYKIRRDDAIRITPGYSFFFQQLANEFNLDYFKGGIDVSQNTKNNTNVFMDYNVFVYSSGAKRYLNNVVHEFKGGVQARPTEKWEYRADFGVKAFEFGNGAMLISDSWIKHYFNDKFNLKAGYRRNNMEQSYTSAVGQLIDGVFTGRSCDNKFYLETNEKLPHQFYSYQMGSFGVIYSQNMLTNEYIEALVGAGRLLYNNPKNKWVNTFAADIVSYNASYQYNLLKIYSKTGQLFGGYFSPEYFNATTLNLKMEGNIKKLHLKYGVKAFGGIQTAMTPDQTTPAWGFSPYVAYDLNDNITINAAYSHLDYASVQRDLFMVNAVIRGFRKHAKN